MTSRRNTIRSSEQGNIFFYILLGIILFAALIYAFSRNTINMNGVSDQKNDLLASEIIEQGNTIKDAVSRIRVKGYSDTQVSFENSVITGYTNANCSIDDCRVFKPTGGNIAWITPPVGSQGTYADWGFSASKDITRIGTTADDLVAILPNLTLDICNKINSKVAPQTLLLVGGGTFNKFTGSYPSGSSYGVFNRAFGCGWGSSFPGDRYYWSSD